jgi:WD40 repeat protein
VIVVVTLRLLTSGAGRTEKAGEILSCAYSPDGAFVLSGGWDGFLRLWETAFGAHVTAVQASPKQLSACSVSPDGKYWLSGSIEGMLSHWDALTHRQVSVFLAHPRPISDIAFHIDGRTMATASWDGNVTLWTFGRDRAGRTLAGHRDIVAGCRFSPDCQFLLSWSHDKTARWWDLERSRVVHEWTSHTDRVTAGGVTPDGKWGVTGARNGVLMVYALQSGREEAKTTLPAEIRSCMMLLDGGTMATVDAAGRITIHSLPSLEELAEFATRLPVQCAQLSPSGSQLALGCSDGQVYFVALDGLESVPMMVTATQTSRRTASALQRLFGKSSLVNDYHCVCPACRQQFDLSNSTVGQSTYCPNCRRTLLIKTIAKME